MHQNNVFIYFRSGFRTFSSYWWKHYLSLKTWYRPFVWGYQRLTRGWADCDTWSLYNHIGVMIAETCRYLDKTRQGFPGVLQEGDSYDDSMNPEVFASRDAEWGRILHKIADGFEAMAKMDDWPEEFYQDGPKHRDWDALKKWEAGEEAKFNEAMILFAKHYRNLWD